MDIRLVSLSEQTTFLIVGPVWLNVEEIASINLNAGDEKDEVHIAIIGEENCWYWEGEEADEVRSFLLERETRHPWESN